MQIFHSLRLTCRLCGYFPLTEVFQCKVKLNMLPWYFHYRVLMKLNDGIFCLYQVQFLYLLAVLTFTKLSLTRVSSWMKEPNKDTIKAESNKSRLHCSRFIKRILANPIPCDELEMNNTPWRRFDMSNGVSPPLILRSTFSRSCSLS